MAPPWRISILDSYDNCQAQAKKFREVAEIKGYIDSSSRLPYRPLTLMRVSRHLETARCENFMGPKYLYATRNWPDFHHLDGSS